MTETVVARSGEAATTLFWDPTERCTHCSRLPDGQAAASTAAQRRRPPQRDREDVAAALRAPPNGAAPPADPAPWQPPAVAAPWVDPAPWVEVAGAPQSPTAVFYWLSLLVAWWYDARPAWGAEKGARAAAERQVCPLRSSPTEQTAGVQARLTAATVIPSRGG
eukprot:gene21808-65474_t